MRIAIMGKGGVGKTTLAGTMARLLARRGRRVLAVDFDPNPGLAYALGMEPTDEGLPPEAVEEGDPKVTGYGWQLASGLTPVEVVERYSLVAPDGVRFLSPGKIDGPDHGVKRSLTAVRQVVRGFDDPDWDVIGDIEAGTTTPYEGYHQFAERVLLVLTPGWTASLMLQRLLPFAGDTPRLVIGSRFPDSTGRDGVEIDAHIPADRSVAAAERLGVAPIDHDPTSPMVRAVEQLVDRLVAVEAPV
ncbi:MAG TPA: AAA family ATPase [Candidatus Dormibacteraeota bacterium]|nr:AAA family ATPase [Candidatus Dormibacteraeota bacterium]